MRTSWRRSWIGACGTVSLLLCLCLSPGPVRAGDQGAISLLSKAEELYSMADFKGALRVLERAAAATGDSRLLGRIHFSVGCNRHGLGQARMARAAFVTALSHDPTLKADPLRYKPSLVRLFLRVRRSLEGKLQIVIQAPGAPGIITGEGYQLVVDGRVRGRVRTTIHELKLRIGVHQVEVRDAPGRVYKHVSVTIFRDATASIVVPVRARPGPRPGLQKADRPGRPGSAPARPLARAGRLAVSLGVGLGTADLEGAHALASDMKAAAQRRTAAQVAEAPTSSMTISTELAVRYYFPYHLLGQVGLGLLHNSAVAEYSASAESGTITNTNMVMELPVAVGGYLVLWDRLYVQAAVGPSIFFFSRSWWEAEPGSISDFQGGAGVGFHALAGACLLLGERLALGLEARYRYLAIGELMELESGQAVEQRMLRTSGSDRGYDLDFSGISATLKLVFFAR